MNYSTYVKRDFKHLGGLRDDSLRFGLGAARRRARWRWAMLALGLGSIALLTGLAPTVPPRPPAHQAVDVALEIPAPAGGFAESDRALLSLRIPFEPKVPARATEPRPGAPAQGATGQAPAPSHAGRLATIAAPATEVMPTPAELPPAEPEVARAPAADRRVVEVASGDSLYTIFKAMGLSAQLMYRVLDAGGDVKRLERLRPGQVFEFELGEDGELRRLVYRPTELESVHVVAGDGGFAVESIRETLDRRQTQASGVISDSLFLSGQRAGLSDSLIMQMAEIFGWDVDFALDIRAGDRFAVIYEELYKDGKAVREGAILAAEFENQGRVLRAVRYTDAAGQSRYYAPDGQSMRKAFLRTPVSFARISSGFSLGRKHPILHRVRAHKGVDYAAPTGTPVRASGDGKVEYIGRKGGYGKTVILKHGGAYTTLYAHLSRYASGLGAGERVRQGQIIGYVGSTGLATGPHLHYEFRVRGTHRNPLTVPLPKAEPIDPKYLADFSRVSERMVAQLELVSRTQLAANEH